MTQQNAEINSPVIATLQIIGGKWKGIILYQLTFGTRRFGQIAARMPSISRKVLSEQLKELEADGLITRVHHPGIPPVVEYSLSELGKSLSPVFDELAAWGRANLLCK